MTGVFITVCAVAILPSFYTCCTMYTFGDQAFAVNLYGCGTVFHHLFEI